MDALKTVCALAAAACVAVAFADERIAGIVRDTEVTHCDATRLGGCAGNLVLERKRGGRTETLHITVPLGTPISHAGEHVLLHALKGKSVIVTQETVRGSGVALAVQVIDADSPTAASARSRSRD